jgi:hypothetical protein
MLAWTFAIWTQEASGSRMDLDDLLQRYFGTSDLTAASPAVKAAGVDRLRVDFGLETERARRFALWSLLYMLGHAPDLDVAFKEEDDREAARDLMDLLAASEGEQNAQTSVEPVDCSPGPPLT